MQNATIVVDKSLIYELEIVLRERIVTLQNESNTHTNTTVLGIVERQLHRAYALHNAVVTAIDQPVIEDDEYEDANGTIMTRRVRQNNEVVDFTDIPF